MHYKFKHYINVISENPNNRVLKKKIWQIGLEK